MSVFQFGGDLPAIGKAVKLKFNLLMIPPEPRGHKLSKMGTGILKTGDAAIDFTLPEAGTDLPFTLSKCYADITTVLIFHRGLY